MTETDNPDGLEWLTGVPGMPRHLREVIGKLGELKKTTTQAIIEAARANLARLMGDDPRLGPPHQLLSEGCAAASLNCRAPIS